MGAGPDTSKPEETGVYVGEAVTRGNAGYPPVNPYGTFPQGQQPVPPPGLVPPSGYQAVPTAGPLPPQARRQYTDRLPFCGCGIGMFLFLLGFVFPIAWFIGAFIFFFVESVNHDPRERFGLLGATIAAGVLLFLAFSSGGFAAVWSLLSGGHDGGHDDHHHRRH